jgi:hypothetical protein
MATQLGLPGIPLSGGIGGALGSLLGNQAVRSIAEWMMLQQLVQAALQPLIAEIGQTSFGQFPTLSSSPVELAAGVVRGHVDPSRAREEAKKSGIDAEPFQLLLDNAGQPLPLQALLEAWRRGLIPKEGSGADSVALEQGIRESDLKNKWTPVVEALQFQLANPGVVIEGWLRAQIDEAKAREILRQNGIDTDTATLMYKSAGRPPSPQELLDLFHRGKIPLDGEGGDTLSVRQGFLETDLKNKWWSVFPALGEYLPPPRTVTAMMREGAFTDAEGAALFAKDGLTPDLVAAYVAAAHHQKTAASKELTKADAIAAYIDGLLPEAGLASILQALGWAPAAAALEIAMAQFRAGKAQVTSAVTNIRSRYIARKITKQVAADALAKLGVATAGQSSYFAVWDVERQNLVARLTPAQWATAVKKGFVTAEQALSQLQGMGYTPFEAWVLLSDHLGSPATATQPTPDLPASYTQ